MRRSRAVTLCSLVLGAGVLFPLGPMPPAHAVGGVTVNCVGSSTSWTYVGNPLPNGPVLGPGSDCLQMTTTSDLTGLGTYNFSNQTLLTDFDGLASTAVTSLPAGTFSGNHSLTSVLLPPNITSIGDEAFDSAYALSSLVIPAGVTTFGVSAFRGTGFTTFAVPTAVTELPDRVFEGTPNLLEVTLHPGVTSIGEYAFYQSHIESIDLPDAMTTIARSTFENAYWLASVDLPSGLTSIGDRAFWFTHLTGPLTMPSSLVSIGANVFQDAPLTAITLNSGLQSIGAGAFAGTNLEGTLSIPASVATLGDNIVTNTHSYDLRNLTFLGNRPEMSGSAFSALDASNTESPRLTFTTGTSGWGDSGACGDEVTVSGYPFTGICIPAISSATPSWIPVEGGSLTISGSNFMSGATASIDGIDLADVVVVSPTTITATVPALAAGLHTLSVTNEGLRTGTASLRVGPPPPAGGSSSSPTASATASSIEEPAPPATQPVVPAPQATGPTAAQLRQVREVRPSRVPALADGVPPGTSIVVAEGHRQRSVLTVWTQGMTVRTGPVTMAVRAQNARGANRQPVDGTLGIPAAPGQGRARHDASPRIQVTASGNAPLTPMRVFLIRQPKSGPRGARTLDLGYLQTDTQGTLRGAVIVRARTAGSYILQINGTGADRRVRSINLPATVLGSPSEPKS